MNGSNAFPDFSNTYQRKSAINELDDAERDEGVLQRHLQRMKDPTGLELLRHLRDRISALEDRLDTTKFTKPD